MSSTSEIFFRRKETAREPVSLPAPLFNRCMLLLNRAATAHVFVPVRTMQYQAVIDSDEIIFVDYLGYAVENGHGGRLIVLAWEFITQGARDSLTEPVPIEVVYYDTDPHDTLRRLMSEFPAALERCEERQKTTSAQCPNARVLPFPNSGL